MQIGVGLSLPLLATRRSGGFSPLSLFTGGTVGAWYDPSDYTTLFTDAAGTTPVTAVEQPVRLMLDKSQGLVLGSEATSGAWLNGYTTTFDTFTSTGPSSFTATTTGAKAPRVAVLASLPAAGWYWIEFTATFTGGSFSTVGVSNTGSPYSAAVATTVLPATGVAFRTLIYTSAAREYLTVTFNATGASTLSVTGVSVKSYAGNHALAPNDLSRPVLRARYNQLTYSEQFDNAAWTKAPTGVITAITADTTVAPDGTTTADRIASTASGTFRAVRRSPAGLTANTQFTFSVYAKAGTTNWIVMRFWDSGASGINAWFNVSTGAVGTVESGCTATITPANNGFYRCTYTRTVGATIAFNEIDIGVCDSDNTQNANTGANVSIWGADLRTGSSAGTYQRIAAATDYATAGFLPYLAFDGVDDNLASGNINLTGTSKVSAFAGATKNNDSNVYAIVDFGASGGGTAGGFSMWAGSPTAGGAAVWASSVQSSAGGTINIISPANFAAPATAVLTTVLDTVNAGSYLRVNGTLQTTSAVDPTDGTFGNIPLRLSRTGANGLPGRIYGIIVAGKQASASEISATEAWMNSKTGAY